MPHFNLSSDPYYNALENTKLGPDAYKNLKIPNSNSK